jgi:hypothetical protein
MWTTAPPRLALEPDSSLRAPAQFAPLSVHLVGTDRAFHQRRGLTGDESLKALVAASRILRVDLPAERRSRAIRGYGFVAEPRTLRVPQTSANFLFFIGYKARFVERAGRAGWRGRHSCIEEQDQKQRDDNGRRDDGYLPYLPHKILDSAARRPRFTFSETSAPFIFSRRFADSLYYTTPIRLPEREISCRRPPGSAALDA